MSGVGISPPPIDGGTPGRGGGGLKKEKGLGRSDRFPLKSSHYRSSARFRHFARVYIVNQLRKHECSDIAEKYAVPEDEDDGSQLMLQHMANELAEERQRQFEDILNRLQLDNDNIEETYRTIVTEIFRDHINWGRVLAFLIFSGSLAVYCAQHSMEERVGDVISWTEDEMQQTVSLWVVQQGGWAAFVEHFDGSWTIEIPQLVVGAGLVAAIVTGGLFLLKKLFD